MSSKQGNPRRDPLPTRTFRKNEAEEEFLEALNGQLVPLEDVLRRELGNGPPILFILGLPRSGTTLLSQLLACGTSLSYVNNIAARFWAAPTVGAYFAATLSSEGWISSLRSTFGRTEGPLEPHEFGYFWSRHLGYRELIEPDSQQRQSIDWPHLRDILWNMCSARGVPFFFKNVLLNWHASELHANIPRSCFVWIKRDRVAVAQSLLKMRQEFMGSRDCWASVKPRDFESLRERPYWEQIAEQVARLERTLFEQWSGLSDDRKLQVKLDDVCREPVGMVGAIVDLLNQQGCEVSLLSERLRALELSRKTEVREPDDLQLIAALGRISD
jgi:hypothetical protein